MAEESFDFNADDVSFSGQMSEEEVNAFDFNLDKDLKLEGLDDISVSSSFDTDAEADSVGEGNVPQFDIDNLLDNISFDESETQKQPFFEPQGDVFSEQGNEPEFVAVADESMVEEVEQTPSFMNEWAETPKDDGNGDWKAPQIYDEPSDELTVAEEAFSDASDEVVSAAPKTEFEEAAVDVEYGALDTREVLSDNTDNLVTEEDVNLVVEEPEEEFVGESQEQTLSEFDETSVGDYAEPESALEPSEETFVNDVDAVETSLDDEAVVAPVVEQEVAAERSVASDVHDAGYAKWFSGAADNQYFEIGRQTTPYSIEGTDVCQAIHINCSFDAYGWLVCFDNGMMMSLSDVREYQLRNGGLPDENGVIRYGGNEFPFKGINRIVIYQSVQYFSYGV